MGVHIHEVVGTVQRAPESGHASAPRAGHGRASEPPPLPEEAVRAFLEREAQLAARVRAD